MIRPLHPLAIIWVLLLLTATPRSAARHPLACPLLILERLAMTRSPISRFFRWLTGRSERGLRPWNNAELRAIDAAPSVSDMPPPTLGALIDAYAAPTPPSDMRGEGVRTRRMAAIGQLRGELTLQERALWAMAAGSLDIGSSRIVEALEGVREGIERRRATIQPHPPLPAGRWLTKDEVREVEDHPIGVPIRSYRGPSGGSR